MKEKKERNPYNNVGISFASEVKILELAKERCAELGMRSFSEYVKQLIKYDFGLLFFFVFLFRVRFNLLNFYAFYFFRNIFKNLSFFIL